MAPQELRRAFAELPWSRAAAEGLARGDFAVGGLVGSSAALLLASLAPELLAPRLVVCSGGDEAEALAQDLALFLGDEDSVRLFPAFDSARAENRAAESGALAERTAVVEALAGGSPPRFVVAPLAAVLQPVPSSAEIGRATVEIAVGRTLDLEDLGARLAAAGFVRVPLAEGPGEWSVRGGIVDLFPRGRSLPVRVELFGDDVESIRRFDPVTQRSVEQVERTLVPVLSVDLAAGIPADGDPEARVRAIRRASLLVDLLPESALIVHVEEHAAAEWLTRFERARPEEDLATLHARFATRCAARRNLRLTASPIRPGEHAATARLLTASGVARDLLTFGAAVGALLEANDQVRLLCGSEGERGRVGTLLAEAGLDGDARLSVEVGHLTHGFQVPALRTALLSYDEIFGRTRLTRPARAAKAPTVGPEWTDLRKGDAVVHLDHGIGIYRGMKRLEHEGRESDHLAVEFAGETLVYVPVTKASLVHRYVGAGDARPKLSKVGGREWESRKQRVAGAVEGVARELLDTQALRAARPGIPSPPDGPEQLEFEATFPFELTADQESAMAAAKADMERDRPMDRLICGDVGFGKTELAVRAAFKAVMAGRQVAVLVPTTVLAEQHGAVFAERFAGYPVLVDVLSRFRTAKEQREILDRIRTGRVDVVIGTHRLVSGDVEFKDLGLVVIDEEQRFGVRAKEALRRYRAEVDVLTLTATPIPRTLHMALLGLRDISSLTIPPRGRRAIETHVISPDDPEVRTAILRELERGGQVYFIHNRVESIEKVAARLRHLVPEARISVVHGQMGDKLIECRMLDFVELRCDVLVATTIVESGLDIPNANTILIDRADHHGLADLHQLRGRVGRYLRRAYCYLLVPPGTLSSDAERRVRAVEELSDLGAGFRIAMRDLEIRGAGNLLGAEQSGHIAAVGYELYCTLLADAVRRVRKDPTPFRTACSVQLPVATAVPEEYVADDRQRIQLCRRLSCAASEEDVRAALEDARDRFGTPPKAVRLLADLARVRILAEPLGVTRLTAIVHDGEERIQLRCVEPNRVKRALGHMGDRVRAVDRVHCHLLLPRQGMSGEAMVRAVLSSLSPPGR